MVTPTVITADEAFAAAGLSQEGEMKEIVAPFAELTQDLWNAQVVVGGSLVDKIDPNSLMPNALRILYFFPDGTKYQRILVVRYNFKIA